MTNTLRKQLDEKYRRQQLPKGQVTTIYTSERGYSSKGHEFNDLLIDSWPTISAQLKAADALAEAVEKEIDNTAWTDERPVATEVQLACRAYQGE